MVRKFLEETYAILRQNESFFHTFHIHIIQCDLSLIHIYPSHFHTFEMDGFTVRIENSLLAEALESLDGKKRDVILRYYFLGFDDTEISKILEVNRSTIQRRRHAGLEFIKKFMEEEE